MTKYLVVFNRDRDFYQVPLALAEDDKLAALVTDYYHGAGPIPLSRLAHRRIAGISAKLARPSLTALAIQMGHAVAFRSGLQRPFPHEAVNHALQRTAARATARAQDNGPVGVLAYSDFAALPFARTDGPRVLFQYHPCVQSIVEVLRADASRWANLSFRPDWEVRDPSRHIRRNEAEVAASTIQICASDFTRRSLIAAGASPDKITVAPYGCPPWEAPEDSARSGRRPSVLFVGQAVQRKGLHHLFEVWPDFSGAELRLVLGTRDPAVVDLIPADAKLVDYPSNERLQQLMRDTDILVLPSLVEGFGLVINEAIAAGCHVVASTNTGISGLHPPSNVATLHQAGDVEDLRRALSTAIEVIEGDPGHRRASWEFAQELSWESFRHRVRLALPK